MQQFLTSKIFKFISYVKIMPRNLYNKHIYKRKSQALNRRGRSPLAGFIWPQCQVYDESRVNCACAPSVVAACATAAAAAAIIKLCLVVW